MQKSKCKIPLKPYLLNNVEDFVVFLGLKMFNSDNSYMFSRSWNARAIF